MSTPRVLSRAGAAVLILGGLACSDQPPPPEDLGATDDAIRVEPALLAAFEPLPAVFENPDNPRTPAKVDLGRMLYYDTRFSAGGEISCYVCHPLHDFGVTHRARGVGHNHQEGNRNEPTVYNAAGHIAQFWDGRAATLEEQALGPPLNPVEMAMAGDEHVERVLRSVAAYRGLFREAFPDEPDPLTFQNFGRAIAAFERGLVTRDRFDRFLQGDRSALTDAEMEGLRTFVETGCVSCHSGPYLGGTSYQRLGTARAWPDQADPGRYSVTGRSEDRMVFKVPGLRNVIQTWPYFHDGSVATPEEAVALMGRHQLGRELTDGEIRSIVTWLRTLNGEVPTDYIEEPVLPRGEREAAGP